jgi:hypothetical protein
VPTKPRVYLDSCCFIELALHAAGKHEAQRDNDVWFLKQLLNASHAEDIEVLTSTLTVAECSHAKGNVSDETKSLFKRFITSGQYVLLVQDSILVAEKARNLRWVHGLTFGGADAIHIASALEMKCDEFITWDLPVHAHAVALGELALYVRFPHYTQCLPDRYRQMQITPAQSAVSENAPKTDGVSENAETTSPPLAPPAEVRGSGDGHPEGEAGDKTAEARWENEGGNEQAAPTIPQSSAEGLDMAGQQFGLAIRHKTTKAVLKTAWFPLERARDEAMDKTTLDAECEFSTEEKDCVFDADAKPGDWIALVESKTAASTAPTGS